MLVFFVEKSKRDFAIGIGWILLNDFVDFIFLSMIWTKREGIADTLKDKIDRINNFVKRVFNLRGILRILRFRS